MVKPFVWSEKYETGSSAIDRQHKELFSKIDELSLAIYKGNAKTNLKSMITFLERYIEEHFKTEEGIMQMAKYPHLSSHIKLHKAFNKIFDDFKLDFEKRGGDSYLAIHLEKVIRKWWEDHVLAEDQRYVPYLENLK
jgi:hemerythrin